MNNPQLKLWKGFFYSAVKYPIASIILVLLIFSIIYSALFFTKVDNYRQIALDFSSINHEGNGSILDFTVKSGVVEEEINLLKSSSKIYLISDEASYTAQLIELNEENGNLIFSSESLISKEVATSIKKIDYFVAKELLWKRLVGER